MVEKYDFSGWATKNDLLCTDGRTIRSGAFKECDGQKVPLVWNHGHKDPTNVLGHAILENRDNGVYAYCKFNNTPKAQHIKEAVKNGDLNGLSIYANQLIQKAGDVLHGAIREVSLVLARANPGATIDTVLAHNGEMLDGYPIEFDEYDRGIFYNDNPIVLYHSDDDKDEEDKKKKEESEDDVDETADNDVDVNDDDAADDDNDDKEESSTKAKNKKKKEEEDMPKDALQHAEKEEEKKETTSAAKKDEKEDEKNDDGKTVKDVVDSMTDEQKEVMYFLVGQAVEDATAKSKEEDEEMKHNIFEGDNTQTLVHSVDVQELIQEGKKYNSLRDAWLAHCEESGEDADSLMHAEGSDRYGIMPKMDGSNIVPGSLGIEALFPDAKNIYNTPEFVKRDTGWVDPVINGVTRSPFARFKTIFADITEDEARARGYIKGKYKKDEVFSLLKREITPQTIYKKQRFDRDDLTDIVDFDILAWIKAEMRQMLDEEIARAILVGDGRSDSSEDKIFETHVKSIYHEDDFYANKVRVDVAANASDDAIAKASIRAIIKARKDYKGSGNPTFYTTGEVLTNMLLLEDANGRIIYDTEEKLRTALRVSRIIEVEAMEGLTREVTVGSNVVTMPLVGIVVNLVDYRVGADKGGAVSMFEDFDIDYNQQKFLIETRLSGMLVKPHSALVIELNKADAQAQG